VPIAIWQKWIWNGSCEKEVEGITGTGLYVCFCSMTTKQRLRMSQKYFYYQFFGIFLRIVLSAGNSHDNLKNFDTISAFVLISISDENYKECQVFWIKCVHLS
jgi:hypothetical protein